ncbi:PepSY domain-containing protein [Thiohalocapsa halophila]|nr:PepSY domain-containing protein [Thiohalocapsa halophila]
MYPPMGQMPRLASTRALVLLLAAAGGSVHADPHDHDRARAALERGEVLPLAEILASVTTRVPGEVVEVELEREDGTWVYELKIIAPDGRLLEVLANAATGRLLKQEEEH